MEREFEAMDRDGDGNVSLQEFKALSDQHTLRFFTLLDQNKDGFLQFDELLTLSYIEASGRPFCAACKDFIPGLFFTCTHCRLTIHNKNDDDAPTSYDLCITCYHARKFQHPHDDFDDNYTLLLKLQRLLLSDQKGKPSQSSQSSPSRPPKAEPSQSRRARMKATMKRRFRRFGEVVSGAVGVAGVGLSIYGMANEFNNDDQEQEDGATASAADHQHA
ncbi:uncharacterized protein LOC129301168 [Prosopis cineraria]|uniref:uncharacterized protein LOC129301168 n=1 Tax=Prosopis cineraria TaxID=364024 RepID=UPI00240F9BBF|nr:uncharacterized protein LOC129301168 [Prosopis cineraria]